MSDHQPGPHLSDAAWPYDILLPQNANSSGCAVCLLMLMRLSLMLLLLLMVLRLLTIAAQCSYAAHLLCPFCTRCADRPQAARCEWRRSGFEHHCFE